MPMRRRFSQMPWDYIRRNDFGDFEPGYEVYEFYGGGPVDLEGRPQKRTKWDYPYSYSEFVLHRFSENTKTMRGVYTDRMDDWDRDKFNRCYNRHLPGKRWENASQSQIQGFMRDYFGDPSIQLIVVMEWCNQSTGYPTWSLHYDSDDTLKPRKKSSEPIEDGA